MTVSNRFYYVDPIRRFWSFNPLTGYPEYVKDEKEEFGYLPGIMSEKYFNRWLTWEEYEYWQKHPLPFGWMILRAPENL